MHFPKIQQVAIISYLMAVALAVHAAPSQVLHPLTLVQSCTEDNVFINLKPEANTINTTCTWHLYKLNSIKQVVAEDSDMQITLYIPKNVTTVGLRCKFTPANGDSISRDQIADVAVSKAARIDGSAQPQQLPKELWAKSIINPSTGETEVTVTITNYKINNTKQPTPYKNDANNEYYQANVIFDLNTERNNRHWYSWIKFQANDELVCSIAPDFIPA